MYKLFHLIISRECGMVQHSGLFGNCRGNATVLILYLDRDTSLCSPEFLPRTSNRGADVTNEHALYMRFSCAADMNTRHLSVAVRTDAVRTFGLFSAFPQLFKQAPEYFCWYNEGVRLDGRGSISGRRKIFVFSEQRPDRLWEPSSLLPNESGL
jgi:hypothetical protein